MELATGRYEGFIDLGPRCRKTIKDVGERKPEPPCQLTGALLGKSKTQTFGPYSLPCQLGVLTRSLCRTVSTARHFAAFLPKYRLPNGLSPSL
jgi:hypothetical protein